MKVNSAYGNIDLDYQEITYEAAQVSIQDIRRIHAKDTILWMIYEGSPSADTDGNYKCLIDQNGSFIYCNGCYGSSSNYATVTLGLADLLESLHNTSVCFICNPYTSLRGLFEYTHSPNSLMQRIQDTLVRNSLSFTCIRYHDGLKKVREWVLKEFQGEPSHGASVQKNLFYNSEEQCRYQTYHEYLQKVQKLLTRYQVNPMIIEEVMHISYMYT